MPKTFKIGDRCIGPDHPPFVICELSGNHNGSLDRALAMVDAAAATGCDAIKLQTYTPDTLTIKSDRDDFRIKGGLWDGQTLHDLYASAYTPYEWHEALFKRARDLGVLIFSTPFDETAIDLLEALQAPAYKVASFEMADHGLVRAIAATGKPMIISTGLASAEDIATTLLVARAAGARDIAVLHCISAYPAPMDQANIRNVPHIADIYDVVSGLSDHTMGTAASVASIALGGCIVEKHFTLKRADGGPDSAFSLEPAEFTALVQDCKSAWAALGKVSSHRTAAESPNLVFRRSLYVVKPVQAGEVFTRDNVRSIRPGFGLAPTHLPDVLGKTATRDIQPGERMSWDLVAGAVAEIAAIVGP